MVTREQVRMARAALDWTVRDLAREAGVSANTVSRYENGTDAMGDTLMRFRRAFESAGILFIDADETGGQGVRFKLRERTLD
ncbi:MAG: helix-turn-helix transcriptional regulator [Alphaproteobacteria bacterium]|nr:helix-turn-helix transcriptional regulator [Alphaproteobacteria bacterium]